MDREDGLVPLSRGQLTIWLSHESGLAGTQWQLGLLGRIDGTVQPGLLLEAIRQGMIDYSDIELPFHDFRGCDDPVRKVREAASLIQRTPMSLSGEPAKFALFRTAVAEYYWFGLCRHISVDGLSMALVCRRIATIYSAMVSPSASVPGVGRPCADFEVADLAERLPDAAALTCGGRRGRWPD